MHVTGGAGSGTTAAVPTARCDARVSGAGRTIGAVRPGAVYLVGAGPGDPKLITVRGLEVLRASDVVVYDRLAHPALLQGAPHAAERIYAGKRPGHHTLRQEQINTLLIDRARGGATVVRLKGGDPFVFGRGGEECEALRSAGVPFEVVPGVTSAIAVPAYAGIPVTHRRHGSAFAVVTGHVGGNRRGPDWSALARMPVLVVLMGLRALPETCRRLIAHGRDARTPAAVVSLGTTARQITVTGTLGTIAQRARAVALPAPTVCIVGDVARLGQTLRWFAPERHVPEGSPGPSPIWGAPRPPARLDARSDIRTRTRTPASAPAACAARWPDKV